MIKKIIGWLLALLGFCGGTLFLVLCTGLKEVLISYGISLGIYLFIWLVLWLIMDD